MSISTEQIGFDFSVEIKNPDHKLVFVSPNGKQFLTESDFRDYLNSEEYTNWHDNRLKMIQFMRDKKEDFVLLEKYYNEQLKSRYSDSFSDLSDEYKIGLSKTIGFASYKLDIKFKIFKSSVLASVGNVLSRVGLKLK